MLSSALTSPLRIASSAISARWSAAGMLVEPERAAEVVELGRDRLQRDPGRLGDLLVGRTG